MSGSSSAEEVGQFVVAVLEEAVIVIVMSIVAIAVAVTALHVFEVDVQPRVLFLGAEG